MKKASKLLSVILAGIMLFSIFTVSASAKEMTKSEVIKFYHSILQKTAEKNKLVLVKNNYKNKYTVDFSSLSGLDLKFTENLSAYVGYDGSFYEESYDEYYYGVCDEYEEAADTELYHRFSISWELEWGYTVKTATYKDNKIIIEIEDDQEYYDNKKITVNLANDNSIKKITEEIYEEYEDYSLIKNVPFMTTHEAINNYTFVYDKVPAKSLTLSETDLTLGYGDIAEITYTVGPDKASFKGVEVYNADNEDYETIAYAYEEDGKIYIEACGEGTGTVEVYTYSGDILATCQVTVEYTVWDRIRSIFDNMFFWIELILGIY